MKANRLISCILLLLIAVSLTSCMPSHELKDLAIVEGVAVDKSDAGFLLTFQLFNPSEDSGSGDEKGGGGSKEIILTGSGKSLFDAIRNATLTEGKKLYFSETHIFVVSEDICKSSLRVVEDFFERPVEIRRDVNILVSKGKASDFLTAKKDGKLVRAMDFADVIRNSGVSSKIININIGTMSVKRADGITDLALTAVKTSKTESGDDLLQADGTAVLKRDKLVGYLTDTETRGLLWATGKVQSGIIILTPESGGRISMEVNKSKAQITTISDHGKPKAEISVDFVSSVVERENAKINLTDTAQLKELETLQEKEVIAEISEAIKKSMEEYDADVLGLGMKFYQDQPELWRKIHSKWGEVLKTLPVKINVKSSIVNTGNITQ